jgi:hypothetical protein
MFGYNFINGRLLSNISDLQVFSELLEKYHDFAFKDNICNNQDRFQKNCIEMYKKKSYYRIKKFQDTDIDKINCINGIFVEPIIKIINKIINKIDWCHILTTAIPVNFHGYFQPENIIIGKNNDIFLIDWRESFGDDLKIGDVYYDLSKLYHGLLINGEIVKEKKYSLDIEGKNAYISYLIKSNLLDFKNILESFCIKYKLDFEKIKLLGVLQYVNIAEFYKETEPEYAKFIFLLGKLLMTENLVRYGTKK